MARTPAASSIFVPAFDAREASVDPRGKDARGKDGLMQGLLLVHTDEWHLD